MTTASDSPRIYLDHAATTAVDPAVAEAMRPYFTERFGNPSSIHAFGQEALQAVETARSRVASLLNADPSEIVFTGGGTESDNAALAGILLTSGASEKAGRLVTTAIEHHAVLAFSEALAERGVRLEVMAPDPGGLITVDAVRRAVAGGATLVSVMHANNEIGTIQPVAEIAAAAAEGGALFHTDAVQTAGHIPIDVRAWGIDLLSVSAHKLYGPKGVGALFVRKGTPFEPFLVGGGQEDGRRSSTHNVPGIVGLGKAAEIAAAVMTAEDERIRGLRDRLWNAIKGRLDGVRLNGHATLRLSNNLNCSFDGVEGESLVIALDLDGIAASTGSACSSRSSGPSHVLTAIGLSADAARGSLRLTLGRNTTAAECDRAADAVVSAVKRLRAMASGGRRA
ncbi:cysteine desulfurase [bacterium]|nr:cysteine desulfurase [bacterium]